MNRRPRILALIAVLAMVVAACGDDTADTTTTEGQDAVTTTSEAMTDTTEAMATTTTAAAQQEVELVLAHSYQEGQAQVRCGANVIAEGAEAAGVGLTVEIFGASALGGDADRIQSVIAGDIDIDIQGASALAAVYQPMAVADGAFVFDDSDHVYNFFTGDASTDLKEGFYEATGVRILGAWNTGARQFTANVPIREPEDLQGLRMRFPPSPSFLLNAEAMGAEAVEVAYEELYLALQQGTVDGQENPIGNINAINLDEVQDYISLSAHQLSTNLVVVGPVWDELSAEQQQALVDAVDDAMIQEPQCAAEDEEEILAAWRDSGDMTIVDDVNREAFLERAAPVLRDAWTEDQIAVYEAIRSAAGG